MKIISVGCSPLPSAGINQSILAMMVIDCSFNNKSITKVSSKTVFFYCFSTFLVIGLDVNKSSHNLHSSMDIHCFFKKKKKKKKNEEKQYLEGTEVITVSCIAIPLCWKKKEANRSVSYAFSPFSHDL
jgi:hypothetical protein